jgi:DNA mismatch endonuclease (patch repair protein)
MADIFTRKMRSFVMARIRSKGNKETELRLAYILREAALKGWRRGHPLAGKPDFVFARQKVAIFVDGCFWHGCPNCYRAPKSNVSYWRLKIGRNRRRDSQINKKLRGMGWSVLRFWKCELEDAASVVANIEKMIRPNKG